MPITSASALESKVKAFAQHVAAILIEDVKIAEEHAAALTSRIEDLFPSDNLDPLTDITFKGITVPFDAAQVPVVTSSGPMSFGDLPDKCIRVITTDGTVPGANLSTLPAPDASGTTIVLPNVETSALKAKTDVAVDTFVKAFAVDASSEEEQRAALAAFNHAQTDIVKTEIARRKAESAQQHSQSVSAPASDVPQQN